MDTGKSQRKTGRKLKAAQSPQTVREFGWGVDRNHVYPVNDLRNHKLTNCWCKPIEDDGLMVHHSLDGRELYETGERVLS